MLELYPYINPINQQRDLKNVQNGWKSETVSWGFSAAGETENVAAGEMQTLSA